MSYVIQRWRRVRGRTGLGFLSREQTEITPKDTGGGLILGPGPEYTPPPPPSATTSPTAPDDGVIVLNTGSGGRVSGPSNPNVVVEAPGTVVVPRVTNFSADTRVTDLRVALNRWLTAYGRSPIDTRSGIIDEPLFSALRTVGQILVAAPWKETAPAGAQAVVQMASTTFDIRLAPAATAYLNATNPQNPTGALPALLKYGGIALGAGLLGYLLMGARS